MATFTKTGQRHSTDQGDWSQVNHFEVEIEGVSIGEFQEVTIPEIEMEVIEYHVGTSRHALKRPGQKKVGDLVLKRGHNVSTILEEWFTRISAGNAERRAITLKRMDEQDNVTASWNFFNTWPYKWKVSNLDASKAEIAVEEVSFKVEEMERAS